MMNWFLKILSKLEILGLMKEILLCLKVIPLYLLLGPFNFTLVDYCPIIS